MNNKLLQEDLASRQLETTQELWPLAQLVAVRLSCAVGTVLFVRPVSLAAPEAVR
jgi:hypothetical protein